MSQSELDILEIISSVGQARNCYIEAIQEAKSGNYEACNEMLKKGNEMYANCLLYTSLICPLIIRICNIIDIQERKWFSFCIRCP